MPFAQVNGQELYFEDTGGNGPAIVFSHGLLMDQSMFAPQVTALRSAYRCITWDERGHGRTAADTLSPFTYYDSADDLVLGPFLARLCFPLAVCEPARDGDLPALLEMLRTRLRGRPDPIVGDDAHPGVEPIDNLDTHQTVIAPVERILGGIRHQFGDHKAQPLTALAWQFARVHESFATNAQRF